MAIRKFLTSVADVFAYDADDNLVFVAKTLLDSSIEASLGSQPVRGGRGNQLQYVYYHTGELNVTLTDTQWNLGMLGSTVGDLETAGMNYYKEETVAMTGPTGTVTDVPLAYSGQTIYGWATSPDGITERVTLSSSGSYTVTGSALGDWCVRYFTQNTTSGTGITIKANMIPKVLKLVMETQLNSADVTSNKIGMVQIIIPKLQLSGAFSISMTADGIANTPLTGMALAYSDAASQGCIGNAGYYATIVEIIDNTNWYDNVVDLVWEGVSGSQLNIAKNSEKQMSLWAIPSSGTAFKVSPSLVSVTGSTVAGVYAFSPTTFMLTTGSTTGSGTLAASIVGSTVSESLKINVLA